MYKHANVSCGCQVEEANQHTHAEWEECERLSLEDSKFHCVHYVHDYYYLVMISYPLIFFQMSPVIYCYCKAVSKILFDILPLNFSKNMQCNNIIGGLQIFN